VASVERMREGVVPAGAGGEYTAPAGCSLRKEEIFMPQVATTGFPTGLKTLVSGEFSTGGAEPLVPRPNRRQMSMIRRPYQWHWINGPRLLAVD
jgi:hypothetical protein